MLEAVSALNKLVAEELHNYERPIAYLAFQTAEMNRDKKRRSKAFMPSDFYFYQTEESKKLPEARYGAAALALIKKKMFPSWALFVYKDLKERAENAAAPEVLCFQCKDAIVLAPSIEGRMLSGMLIISNEISEQVTEMTSPCGKVIRVMMPKVNSRYEANEEAELRILS